MPQLLYPSHAVKTCALHSAGLARELRKHDRVRFDLTSVSFLSKEETEKFEPRKRKRKRKEKIKEDQEDQEEEEKVDSESKKRRRAVDTDHRS